MSNIKEKIEKAKAKARRATIGLATTLTVASSGFNANAGNNNNGDWYENTSKEMLANHDKITQQMVDNFDKTTQQMVDSYNQFTQGITNSSSSRRTVSQDHNQGAQEFFDRGVQEASRNPQYITREIFDLKFKMERNSRDGMSGYTKSDLNYMFTKMEISPDDPRVEMFFNILQNKADRNDGVTNRKMSTYRSGRGYEFDKEGYYTNINTLENSLKQAGFSEKELVRMDFTAEDLARVFNKMGASKDDSRIDKCFMGMDSKHEFVARNDGYAYRMTEHSFENRLREAGFSEQEIARGFSKNNGANQEVQQSEDLVPQINEMPKAGVEPTDLKGTVKELQANGFSNKDIIAGLDAFVKYETTSGFDITKAVSNSQQQQVFSEISEYASNIESYGRNRGQDWRAEIIESAKSISKELKASTNARMMNNSYSR